MISTSDLSTFNGFIDLIKVLSSTCLYQWQLWLYSGEEYFMKRFCQGNVSLQVNSCRYFPRGDDRSAA